MSMTATYSPEDDKLRLYSLTRLDDETYQRVKKAGFRWAPKQELFFTVWSPIAEDICTELAGEIGDEDTSLADRAEQRAERFSDYSEHRARDAEQAHKAVHAIADNIPLGQPILIGHHSERHARKDAERIDNGMRRALKMWETSAYWTDRAAGAIRHAKYLERPDVRARRIKGLESDIRVYRGGRGGSWVPVEDLPGIEKHYSRWIDHAEHRLAYEKAMLDEQGATDLLKPKPRSAAAQLPLCNYRVPEGLDIENKWRRGEIIHYPQMEMTSAEYVAINADYKGTRVVGNSHRVRTAMRQGSLYCVFITDGKTHTPPAAIAPQPVSEPTHRETYHAPEPTEAQQKIDQLRQAVKAGVQVVSAPQLFPTPPDLAERMVQLAGIEPGMSVLEPSAGTGNILRAIGRDDVTVTAVEINPRLCGILNTTAAAHDVRCADFLSCNGDLGKFDRILMNPPFANGQDIEHIAHAVNLLKPGGRLVAICAGGPRQEAQIKPIAETWEPLPAGTFKESGTNVNAVLLTIERER